MSNRITPAELRKEAEVLESADKVVLADKLRMAAIEIERLKKELKRFNWISVRDETPNFGDVVLFFTDKDYITTGHRDYFTGEYLLDKENYSGEKVIAWMRLPDDYEW